MSPASRSASAGSFASLTPPASVLCAMSGDSTLSTTGLPSSFTDWTPPACAPLIGQRFVFKLNRQRAPVARDGLRLTGHFLERDLLTGRAAETLAAELGYTPLYVRYNSGRHISVPRQRLLVDPPRDADGPLALEYFCADTVARIDAQVDALLATGRFVWLRDHSDKLVLLRVQ